MATGKNSGGSKGKGGMDWSRGIDSGVVHKPTNTNPPEPHVPWSLLVTLVVMCVVLGIFLPVLGIMYGDMNNAVTAAQYEFEKMRAMRRQLAKEIKELRDANSQPATPVTPEE